MKNCNTEQTAPKKDEEFITESKPEEFQDGDMDEKSPIPSPTDFISSPKNSEAIEFKRSPDRQPSMAMRNRKSKTFDTEIKRGIDMPNIGLRDFGWF